MLQAIKKKYKGFLAMIFSALVGAIYFGLASYFDLDLLERAYEGLEAVESYELDELIVVAFFLLIGGVVDMLRYRKSVDLKKVQYKELLKYRESLEEAIEERTRELKKTNALLSESIKDHQIINNNMIVLHSMGEMLQSCETEKETFQVIRLICCKLFPDDRFVLSMFRENDKVFEEVATNENSGRTGTFFEGNSCWAFRKSNPHIVTEPDIDLRCEHLKEDPSSISYICYPLISRGKMIGHFHLCMKETGIDQILIDHKKNLVKSINGHYGAMLQNLRFRLELKTRSIKDSLTGLYNRRYLEEYILREENRAKRHGSSIAVIMLDLDHFKMINDTYGHAHGDLILEEMGKILEKESRHEDIACRYGGEEFLLIKPNGTISGDIGERMERLRNTINQHTFITQDGKKHNITISAGVAWFPLHGESLEKTINAADNALYRAKKEGRNRVVFMNDKSN